MLVALAHAFCHVKIVTYFTHLQPRIPQQNVGNPAHALKQRNSQAKRNKSAPALGPSPRRIANAQPSSPINRYNLQKQRRSIVMLVELAHSFLPCQTCNMFHTPQTQNTPTKRKKSSSCSKTKKQSSQTKRKRPSSGSKSKNDSKRTAKQSNQPMQFAEARC